MAKNKHWLFSGRLCKEVKGCLATIVFYESDCASFQFTGGEMRTVMQKVSTPMTVRIYHKLAQPKLPNKVFLPVYFVHFIPGWRLSLNNFQCYNSGCDQMCLPRAVYRKSEPALETEWHDRPYACMCQGNTPTDLIECAGMGFSWVFISSS